MNRKIFIAVSVMILLIAIAAYSPAVASPPPASTPPPGDVVIHLPYDTGTVNASPGQDVWLKVGWGAATPALVRLAEGAIQINVTLDGTHVSIPFARRLWGPIEAWTPTAGVTCPNNTGYRSYWYYDLGTLSTGDHPLDAVLSVKHQLNDGCSTGGVPDTYSGVYATDSVTISVSP